MKDAELAKMSVSQLEKLRTTVDTHLVESRERAKQSVLERCMKLATDAGFRVKVQFVGHSNRAPVKIKYQDPTNKSNTWTGRGKAPRWLAAKLKSGSKREDFLIVKS